MECERKKFQCEGEVEELEGLLGPEDVDVDFRRILKGAKRAQDFRNFPLE